MLPSFWRAARLAGVTALGACAVACSSYTIAEPAHPVLHPFASIPPEFGRVCVIRPRHFYARAVTVPVWDNDALVGATKGGTYFCYRAEPGAHAIRMKADEETVVPVTVAAGQSYYLRQRLPFRFFTKVHVEAAFVAESEAHEAVEEAKYEVVVEAPEVVPTHTALAAARPPNEATAR